MPTFTKIIKAGGVAQTLDPKWGATRPLNPKWADDRLDEELKYQEQKFLFELLSELEKAGYLTIGPNYKDGDYTKRKITLTIPDSA